MFEPFSIRLDAVTYGVGLMSPKEQATFAEQNPGRGMGVWFRLTFDENNRLRFAVPAALAEGITRYCTAATAAYKPPTFTFKAIPDLGEKPAAAVARYIDPVSDAAPEPMWRPTKADLAAAFTALEICAVTFLRYEQMHKAKGTPDGDLKAQANADMAAMCRAVLDLRHIEARVEIIPLWRWLFDDAVAWVKKVFTRSR